MIEQRPLWAGRTIAFLGILSVALNLRTAVGSLSPLLGEIGAELAISSVQAGILGTLPPLCFALFGFLTPFIARRFSVEALLIVAIIAMVLGHFIRASAGDYTQLVLGSILCFGGTGAGNALLPPILKKYFADRIGFMTSMYSMALVISSLVPPLVAVPVAETVTWNASLGLWGIVAGIAAIPWVTQFAMERRRGVAPRVEADRSARARRLPVAKSWITWAIVAIFVVNSTNAYAMFGWLPILMQDLAGVTPREAGTLLSVFSMVGIPATILVPLLATRMKRIFPLVWAGGVFFTAGYLGLILAPTAAPLLWVVLIGLGPLLFPLCLTLINLRSSTQAGSVTLSGFVQGIAYVTAALGPYGLGVIHQATGSWIPGLIALSSLSVLLIPAGLVISKQRTVEEELISRGRLQPPTVEAVP